SIDDMCLNYSTVGSCDDLKADLVTATADRALTDGAEVRTREGFIERAGEAWRKLSEAGSELAELVREILAKYQAISVELAKPQAAMLEPSVIEMRRDLEEL